MGNFLAECSGLLFALNLLRAHEMQQPALQKVLQAKVLSKIVYASSSWWGFTNSNDRFRINSFLNKCKKLGFYPQTGDTSEELCEKADEKLLTSIVNNKSHVLHRFLPLKKTHQHNLHPRKHDFELPSKDNSNFVSKILFKDVN